MFSFTLYKTAGRARLGSLSTPHGKIETPCFMPCGTKATVKTLDPEELKTLGCQILLGNTYHLMLRPGGDLVEKMGGLHKWMKWDRPILTDSGGFQVFSLHQIRKIQDDGVEFKSHINGDKIFLSPEKATQIQEQLGADIIMAFDECAPTGVDKNYTREATERTHRWLVRCMAAQTRKDQALFPIVQGGFFSDLRKESAEFAVQQNPVGIAIGGVSVGESREEMHKVVEDVEPILPKDKPRYVMGVGEPLDLFNLVARGIDMFDCVLPTRLARHGSFWNIYGRQNINKSEYRTSELPLDQNCTCSTCSRFSTSYIRHLIIENEILGHRLMTIHNLHFLFEIMRNIRLAISEDRFAQLHSSFLQTFNSNPK